jgi:hypothetical protein
MKRKAGRPAITNKAHIRSIRLTDNEYTQFKLMGGVVWIRKLLAATEKLIK